MWPDQLAKFIVNTFDIMGPTNQALTTWFVLCGYGMVVLLVVGVIVAMVERPNE